MRLLECGSDGIIRFTRYFTDDIPPYAILSHTWGAEDEEVTFHDLIDIPEKDKRGFKKIQFCADQAARDGLKYFWVDTCCIDRSNSTELTEAINSMYHWYRRAAKCYVYLSDVGLNSTTADNELNHGWKVQFKNSRWFRRGWTLQELIAPASVEFFSVDGELLCDRASMHDFISEITGIAIQALQGTQLSSFSVQERMGWADRRTTKREEDMAYCLLGILDVHMPLIYGEGRRNARTRLQNEVDQRWRKITEIRRWLAAPDPSNNYEKARQLCQTGTGTWFLESKQYMRWKTHSSLIWLHGIPGCGKTVLSSTILSDIFQYTNNDREKLVAYFYFDFNDQQMQDPELMVRSVISQISRQFIKIPKSLDTLFQSCGNGQRQPSLPDLVELLHQFTNDYPHIFIVLDALDECRNRSGLMKTIQEIATSQLDGLHILLTSRREGDIERCLSPLIHQEDDIVSIQSNIVDGDIQAYIQQRLCYDNRLQKWQRDLVVRQEIESVLMVKAHGMFRWAACQLDILGDCRSRLKLREALANLPPTLDETYDRILMGIKDTDTSYAIRILRWLAFASRPLKLSEIARIAAIDLERNPAFDRDDILEDPREVLDICSSLVTIREATDDHRSKRQRTKPVVFLAHYSVKEYLVSGRISKSDAAIYAMEDSLCHGYLAKCCLHYLLQYNVGDPDDFPLADYSAREWITHAKVRTDEDQTLTELILRLFNTNNEAYLTWLQLFDPDKFWRRDPDFTREVSDCATPLYYAAKAGFTKVAYQLIVSKGADINGRSGDYGSALAAASVEGYEQVVDLLVDKGAEINEQGGIHGSALTIASGRGHEKIVKRLLDKGADVNGRGGTLYNSALAEASRNGHEQIVKLLLDNGADINMYDRYDGTALVKASREGHEQIVKLLLDNGADTNTQVGYNGNALGEASRNGHEQIVRLLLDNGADVNAQGPYNSALVDASRVGHEQIVKLLLDRGADVNTLDGYHGSALAAASKGGHEHVVELLLDRGADINMQCGDYGSALAAASSRGREHIVELLLDKGADINVQGGHGSALVLASNRGHKQTVQLLLDRGAIK